MASPQSVFLVFFVVAYDVLDYKSFSDKKLIYNSKWVFLGNAPKR